MFGHESEPSKVLSYGAGAPVEGADVVDEQMRLAHRYRNALVAQEIERRRRVDEALRTLSPELATCEEAIAAAEKALEDARVSIDRASAEARRKVRPPEAVEAVKTARSALKIERARRKELRSTLFASEPWKAKDAEINEWDLSERKRLRGSCGIYHSTYLHVEQSMGGCRSGAPPKFKRWTGDGHLAIQIVNGMDVEKLFSGGDRRIQVERPEEGKYRVAVKFRVKSEENGDPIWAVLPVVLDRARPTSVAKGKEVFPAGVRIKWIHLIRRRIATQYEWRVQFIVSRKDGWARPDSSSSGDVGIDVGWRLRDDGALRTAYWIGSDGEEGELVLPSGWMQEMRRVEFIRSCRDKLFDIARAEIAKWVGALEVKPEWLAEAAATLSAWKAPARLAALCLRWRENRIAGDDVTVTDGGRHPLYRTLYEVDRKGHLKLSGGEGIYALLEAWRRRDKHLYEFEGNLRHQLLRRRQDIYRVFAAQMRRRYKVAHIEDLDLRDFHILPKAEEPGVDGALKEHVRDACLSVLRQSISQSMALMVEHPAKDTTRRCADCGHVGEASISLILTCEGCGKKEDQDRRAARNLLALGLASIPVTVGS